MIMTFAHLLNVNVTILNILTLPKGYIIMNIVPCVLKPFYRRKHKWNVAAFIVRPCKQSEYTYC